ncbi:hypothetical protein EJB05_03594, partial [Eragrostis curvula]
MHAQPLVYHLPNPRQQHYNTAPEGASSSSLTRSKASKLATLDMSTMAVASLLPSQLLAALPEQWQLGLLALLPVMLLSFAVLIRNRSTAAKNGGVRLPPGPAQVPVLGNLHQLGPLPHRSLRELARQHGPVMLLRLGTVPTVVVSSAEAAREVMKAHDVDCCSRPVSPGPKRMSYDLKNVAFAPYDEYWREMRKLFIVELLSMRRVKAAWYAREEQVDKLLGNLRRMGPKPVALNEHIFRLADGIIGTVAFGNIYGTERFAHKKQFQHVLDEAMDMMASFSAEDFFPNAAGRLVDRVTGLVARRERIFRDLDAFFEMVIDQHTDPKRPKPENGGDLVDVLINLWKEHRGTLRFTREHVKGIILNLETSGKGKEQLCKDLQEKVKELEGQLDSKTQSQMTLEKQHRQISGKEKEIEQLCTALRQELELKLEEQHHLRSKSKQELSVAELKNKELELKLKKQQLKVSPKKELLSFVFSKQESNSVMPPKNIGKGNRA